MEVTEKLREDTKDIWDKIANHPFIIELCSGSLPDYKFKFYLLHDYNYLVSAIKNFNLITLKTKSIEDLIEIIHIGYIAAESEYKSYVKLLDQYNLSISDAAAVKPISVVSSYLKFLFNISKKKSFPEALVSILPCFWSYGYAVQCNKTRISINKNLVYCKWANEYLSRSYIHLLERIKNLVNKVSVNFPYTKLKEIFIRSSKYEYLYWDAMYNVKNYES